MKADLHLHSIYSDGVLTPSQLCDRAGAAGLDLIALTDHDEMDGIASLQGQPPVRVLSGVELSLRNRDGLHLLCYGLPAETPLHERVRALSYARKHRGDAMLDRCEAYGLHLDRQAVHSSAQGSLGRPHIARALVQAGYCRSINEAFDRFLGTGKPCYVAGERLSMEEALPLALQSGYVPVLAHPWEMADSEIEIRALVQSWQELGLAGIEVYHPSTAKHGFDFLFHLAEELGLIVTGGSDFHQDGDKHAPIGGMLALWRTCDRDINRLEQALKTAEDRFRASSK